MKKQGADYITDINGHEFQNVYHGNKTHQTWYFFRMRYAFAAINDNKNSFHSNKQNRDRRPVHMDDEKANFTKHLQKARTLTKLS